MEKHTEESREDGGWVSVMPPLPARDSRDYKGGGTGTGLRPAPKGFDVDSPAGYLNWWFIQISIPNLLLIVGMVVVFILALVAPFPHATEEIGQESRSD